MRLEMIDLMSAATQLARALTNLVNIIIKEYEDDE